ncbi:MAG: DJ-1/PfpI family protein [Bacteroidales bacterium]|jgi:4-methyl-5(b-hydroxyethyl)-thiazole monophosphate biosynthesis|nr:DJ-1/PfpI family protein [Bacteroidales bacterium]
MATKIYIFLAEGFEEIEAITPIDILRRAECDVVTVSVTGKKTVSGAQSIPIIADMLFEDCNFADADVLYLPGGLPGATNLNKHKGLKQLVKQHVDSGKLMAAICAAPLVLGGLGLLKNKKATCYPGFEDRLIGADVTGEQCVVADNIITGNGPGAAAKLGYVLVAKVVGKTIAEQLEKGMMFA